MKPSKEKLIELYDIIFPRSLEDDNDVKAIEMQEILDGKDTIMFFTISELKFVSQWMIKNELWP